MAGKRGAARGYKNISIFKDFPNPKTNIIFVFVRSFNSPNVSVYSNG